MRSRRRFTLKSNLGQDSSLTCCDYLAEHTGLSKSTIKDAMGKGAVWLTKQAGKRRRLRRATTMLHGGDAVEIYYDADILQLVPPSAHCIDDQQRYSVWSKPSGLMAQGTEYGDHCSLLRQVERHFHPRRPAFLVHRLDREAAGLMIIAHDGRSASRMSSLFRDHHITKHYRVQVKGHIQRERGEITLPLDGKPALTRYEVTDYDSKANVTTLDVNIVTGRLHQIRRHFEAIGHGVLGDPRYGAGNKNREGLQLIAVGLSFRCPFTGCEMTYTSHDIFKKVL